MASLALSPFSSLYPSSSSPYSFIEHNQNHLLPISPPLHPSICLSIHPSYRTWGGPSPVVGVKGIKRPTKPSRPARLMSLWPCSFDAWRAGTDGRRTRWMGKGKKTGLSIYPAKQKTPDRLMSRWMTMFIRCMTCGESMEGELDRWIDGWVNAWRVGIDGKRTRWMDRWMDW